MTVTLLRLSGSNVGRVTTMIVEDASGNLFLQVHVVLPPVGVGHGSAQEADHLAGFGPGCPAAVLSTLATLCEVRRSCTRPLSTRPTGATSG